MKRREDNGRRKRKKSREDIEMKKCSKYYKGIHKKKKIIKRENNIEKSNKKE